MRTKFKGCSDDIFLGFIVGIISMFIVSVICVAYVLPIGVTKDETVKQGHAEYYLDEDNQRQWRWLPAQEKENALPEIPPAEAK